jgi:site-specific DNA-methyltransferase (adenine-specific)
MTPYYQEDGVTIYHGDCRDINAWDIAGGVMVTDPPYGIGFVSGWTGSQIANDENTAARDTVLDIWAPRPALVFGAAGEALLPGASMSLIWHRPGSGMGDLTMPWKPDFELIHVIGKCFRSAHRGSAVMSVPWDVFRGDALHPHQKPISLLRRLIINCPPLADIVDPFMGSGTTLRAAKDLGRSAIGVEIEERYCEIAARRLAQGVLDFGAVS